MFLSKDKSRNHYQLYYHASDGTRKKVSTGTNNKREAEKFMAQFKVPEPEKPRILVRDYCKTFLYRYSAHYHAYGTSKAYQCTFEHFKKTAGKLPLEEVTSKIIRDYLNKRKETGSVFMARKDWINLSGFFRRAIEDGLISVNPVKGIKQFPLPEQFPLFLSEVEYKKLLETITDPELKDLVVFAVHTGMRISEILNLTWRQVNMNSCLVMLDNRTHITKNGRVRSVPLNAVALDILKRKSDSFNGQYVFTFSSQNIKKNNLEHRFKRAILKAGLDKKLHFHSLRHTFASWLVQRGESIYIVSKLLGHRSIKTTQIYSHLCPENFQSAVERISTIK